MILAGIDIGTNTLRMLIVDTGPGYFRELASDRRITRLGQDLDRYGVLAPEAIERSLEALAAFQKSILQQGARHISAIGTSALRRTKNASVFIDEVHKQTGIVVQVISGEDEARLILLGIEQSLAMQYEMSTRALHTAFVMDIGGGSTEIIIGEHYEPLELESLQMGCVSLSQRFFGDGRLSDKRLERARLAARLELEPIQAAFTRRGWERAVGSSGTVRVIGNSLRELDPTAASITPAGLEQLLARLGASGHLRELDLDAVSEDRRPVFPGGVVILTEIISALGIEQMRFVEGALRDGLLYDMVGRMTRSDARERTVNSMQRRYHVDLGQAERVEATAVDFLAQVQDAWGLSDPLAELSLRWAARLHEIGLDVAHNGYHRHGAYLLENADMPGFAREEQQLMARLVGSHRRKLGLERLEDLIPPWDRLALRLIVLLRVAVLLHRGRSADALPEIELSARGSALELRFPARWLDEHPLTVADLQLEIGFLRPHGLRLRVFSGNRGS